MHSTHSHPLHRHQEGPAPLLRPPANLNVPLIPSQPLQQQPKPEPEPEAEPEAEPERKQAAAATDHLGNRSPPPPEVVPSPLRTERGPGSLAATSPASSAARPIVFGTFDEEDLPGLMDRSSGPALQHAALQGLPAHPPPPQTLQPDTPAAAVGSEGDFAASQLAPQPAPLSPRPPQPGAAAQGQPERQDGPTALASQAAPAPPQQSARATGGAPGDAAQVSLP